MLVFLFSCSESINIKAQNTMERTSDFDGYWFQSKAEITSYTLEQVRYGKVHNGTATLIFVTEPFNTSKAVKSDNGIGKNVQSVLKQNHIRKFNTGIYPYSIMTSSFTPVSQTGMGSTFKVTNSVQEWCGQVYNQMVKKGNQYDINSFSYFESEGDERKQVKATLLEDEIMSLIRINPEIIKEGKFKIIPAAHFLRMVHKELKPYEAVISIAEISKDGQQLVRYEIDYSSLDRKLAIFTSRTFPFSIEEWSEEYSSFGGKPMKTSAVKKERMMMDYWNKNKPEDRVLYDQLFSKK